MLVWLWTLFYHNIWLWNNFPLSTYMVTISPTLVPLPQSIPVPASSKLHCSGFGFLFLLSSLPPLPPSHPCYLKQQQFHAVLTFPASADAPQDTQSGWLSGDTEYQMFSLFTDLLSQDTEPLTKPGLYNWPNRPGSVYWLQIILQTRLLLLPYIFISIHPYGTTSDIPLCF